MPEVRLEGCRSRPLVGYLKALGLLRVVTRQADPEARGRWAAGTFELSSELDREALEDFLLERYSPAPIISPWNGRGGFLEKRNKELDAIESSADSRLGEFRSAIETARSTLAELKITATPSDELKGDLLRALRERLSDIALEWLDAVVVLVGPIAAYPPLLGSGGNDGSFDFSKAYAEAVVDGLTIDSPKNSAEAQAWAQAALYGESAQLARGLSLGYFLRDFSPGNPPGTSNRVGNPWDLILGLEGSLMLVAGAARRHASALPGHLVAPFTVSGTTAGYGSATAGENGMELWLPLWRRWCSLVELETIMGEARAKVGRRNARNGLDFIRAAGELGVARGIEAFERYAILKRAGRDRLAVPAGRVEVRARPAVTALRSLDRWIDRAESYERGDCPRSHAIAIRRLRQALVAFAATGTSLTACTLLERIGELEGALGATGGRADGAEDRRPGPVARVPAGPWLEAADDGTAEFAVAVALGSLRDGARGGLRDYLHGTEWDEALGRRVWGAGRLRVPRRAEATTRLAALHARRHLDAMEDSPSFSGGLPSPLPAASAFAQGLLDSERIIRLTAGLSLLDYRGIHRHDWRARIVETTVDPAYAILALAWSGAGDTRLVPRPGWANRLSLGKPETVLREALLTLRMAELPPAVSLPDLLVRQPDGPRLGAALLLHLSEGDRHALARHLTLQPARATTEGVR